MQLPRLELPEGTLLLREQIAGGPDRSGNSRLLIRDDGAILHARNETLWAEHESDAPAAHWNTPLQSVGVLAPEQLAKLRSALERADLDDRPAGAPRGHLSDPVYERLTAVRDTTPVTVVAERGGLPARLGELRETLDAVVDAALRVER